MTRDPDTVARAREAAADAAYDDLRPPGETTVFYREEALSGAPRAAAGGTARITVAFDPTVYATVKAVARQAGTTPGRWITAVVAAEIGRRR